MTLVPAAFQFERLLRATGHGHCAIVFLSDLMTCYWEVKIEAFSGVRLEIGVATRRCIRRGGLDKDEVRIYVQISFVFAAAAVTPSALISLSKNVNVQCNCNMTGTFKGSSMHAVCKRFE